MRACIDETNRRRAKQIAYNEAHGIVPKTIIKSVRDLIEISAAPESSAKVKGVMMKGLRIIAGNLEKKIKSELLKLLKEDREKYLTFWKAFGRQIKYGVVSGYGAHKDLLQDLLLFWSSAEKKLVTLDEYADRMPGEQKYIWYAAGETPEKADRLPQTALPFFGSDRFMGMPANCSDAPPCRNSTL